MQAMMGNLCIPHLRCMMLVTLAACTASPTVERADQTKRAEPAPSSVADEPGTARDQLAQRTPVAPRAEVPSARNTNAESTRADEAAAAPETFVPPPISEAARADGASTVFRPARLACTRKACKADPCCNQCRGEWRSEGFGLKLEGEGLPRAVTDSCGRREFDIRAVGRRVAARFIAERWWKIAAGEPHQIGSNANGPRVSAREKPTVTVRSLRIVDGDRGFALAPVKALVERGNGALVACLADLLRSQPDATLGEATLRFTVQPSGAVTDYAVSGAAHEQLKDCMLNVARRYRLRPSPEQPLSIEVEMRFDRAPAGTP